MSTSGLKYNRNLKCGLYICCSYKLFYLYYAHYKKWIWLNFDFKYQKTYIQDAFFFKRNHVQFDNNGNPINTDTLCINNYIDYKEI